MKAATKFRLRGVTASLFQSTPPVKAATPKPLPSAARKIFQSTPPVKAATAARAHSAHAGRLFQSTPPVKAATLRVALDAVGQAISIHAAREGGDPILSDGAAAGAHFNPRRP